MLKNKNKLTLLIRIIRLVCVSKLGVAQLVLHECRVCPMPGHQTIMCAAFYYAAAIHHRNNVCTRKRHSRTINNSTPNSSAKQI